MVAENSDLEDRVRALTALRVRDFLPGLGLSFYSDRIFDAADLCRENQQDSSLADKYGNKRFGLLGVYNLAIVFCVAVIGNLHEPFRYHVF